MPDVSISKTSTENYRFNQRSTAMSDAENAKGISQFLDPNQYRKPDFWVYVFSVVDPRPAGAKLVRQLPPVIKRLEIAELKPGQKYTLVTKFGHPINQPDINNDSGARFAHFHDARRVAMDVVNPGNPSLNQDFQIKAEDVFSEGDDYGKLGVFWSLNEVPTEEEIAKAVQRKENHYRARLQQARVLETSDPKALNAWLKVTDHVAADYFGEEFSWHRTAKKPEFCPNCGDSIKPGVAFHNSGDGTLCVIDWKRTVAAGKKTKAEVPEEHRWWEPKSSREKAS